MGVVYNTTKQYEPITIPPEASAAERRAWQRLMDILDDIYLRYGRLTVNDLAKTTIQAINAQGVFDSAQIKDLQATLARFATAEIGSVTITSGQVGDLATRMLDALHADLTKANIGSAEIERVEAEALEAITAKIEECVAGTIDAQQMYADIVTATQAILDEVKATNVITQNFTSAIANISFAQIASASVERLDVDFLSVKDSTTDTAIFRQGTAGEVYIDRLALNEGNAVSLSVGRLMLQDPEDGKWYALTVGKDGVGWEPVEVNVTDTNVGDNSLSGDKIVKGSINVEKLNASTLQGNQAFLVELVSAIAKFGTLFANEAILDQLKTTLIQSDYLRVIIEQTPGMLEGLNKYFDFADGLRISADGSNFSSKWTEEMLGFYQSAKLVAYISNNMFHADRLQANVSLGVGEWQWSVAKANHLTLRRG